MNAMFPTSYLASLTAAATIDREISVGELELAMGCLHTTSIKESRLMLAEASRTPAEVTRVALSRAAHDLVAGIDAETVIENLRHDTPTLGEGELHNVVEKATLVASRLERRKRSKGSKTPEVIAPSRKTLTSYLDPTSLWKIWSRAHQVEWKRDERGEYLQITMQKYTYVIHDRFMKSARLHGLVHYMRLSRERSDVRIKLVVESMRSTFSRSEWMDSDDKVSALLGEVRETLKGIEASKVEQATDPSYVVPRTAGEHCFGCPLKCRQGMKAMRRINPALQQHAA